MNRSKFIEPETLDTIQTLDLQAQLIDKESYAHIVNERLVLEQFQKEIVEMQLQNDNNLAIKDDQIKSMASMNTQNQYELKELRSQLQNANQKTATAVAVQNQLELQSDKLQKENNRLDALNSKLDDDILELNANIKSKEESIKKLNQKKLDDQQVIQGLEAEVSSKQHYVDQKEAELVGAKLQTKLAQDNAVQAQKLVEKKQEVINAHRKEIVDLTKQLDNCQYTINKRTSQMKAQETELLKQQEQIAALKQTLQDKEDVIQDFGQQLQQLNHQIEDLQIQIQQELTKNQTHSVEKQQILSQLKNTEGQNKIKQEKIEKLQKRVTDLVQQNTELKTHSITAEDQANYFAAEAKQKDSDNFQLQDQCSELTKSVNNAQDDIKTLTDDLNLIQKNLKDEFDNRIDVGGKRKQELENRRQCEENNEKVSQDVTASLGASRLGISMTDSKMQASQINQLNRSSHNPGLTIPQLQMEIARLEEQL